MNTKEQEITEDSKLEEGILFSESQLFLLHDLVILFVFLVMIICAVLIPSFADVGISLSIFILFFYACFFDLTIEVKETELELFFSVPIVDRIYPIESIASAKIIPSKGRLGYGIRYKRGTWIYSASGKEALELTFKNSNKKIVIGTHHAPELLKALESAMLLQNLKENSTQNASPPSLI